MNTNTPALLQVTLRLAADYYLYVHQGYDINDAL